MNKYNVEIIEILSTTIQVNADDEEEAYNIAHMLYNTKEVVLSDDDYVDTVFQITKENDEDR